jgi:hypothetical protein
MRSITKPLAKESGGGLAGGFVGKLSRSNVSAFLSPACCKRPAAQLKSCPAQQPEYHRDDLPSDLGF